MATAKGPGTPARGIHAHKNRHRTRTRSVTVPGALDRAARSVSAADNGFLRGGTRPPTEVMVGYIDQHRDEFGVESICKVLQVAPSTYYAAKTPAAVRRRRGRCRDAAMMQVLMVLWVANRKVYGAHKLWKAARRGGPRHRP